MGPWPVGKVESSFRSVFDSLFKQIQTWKNHIKLFQFMLLISIKI